MAVSGPMCSSVKPSKARSRSAPACSKASTPLTSTLEQALKLLSLPREVGRHPEDGEPIVASVGRYGPYVQHGKTYANLEPGDDVLDIGLNRAVTLIAEKIAKGPRAAASAGDPGRALGDHPDKGGAVVVKYGRYGPYVTHDGINATLPSDKTPETITLEEALGLIAARAERTGGGKRPAGKGAKAQAEPSRRQPKKAKGKAKPAEPRLMETAASTPTKLRRPLQSRRSRHPPPAPRPQEAGAGEGRSQARHEAAPKRAKAGK